MSSVSNVKEYDFEVFKGKLENFCSVAKDFRSFKIFSGANNDTEYLILELGTKLFLAHISECYHLNEGGIIFFHKIFRFASRESGQMLSWVDAHAENCLLETALAIYRLTLLLDEPPESITPKVINYIPNILADSATYEENGSNKLHMSYYLRHLKAQISVNKIYSELQLNKLKRIAIEASNLESTLETKKTIVQTEFEKERDTFKTEVQNKYHELKQIIAASFDKLDEAYKEFEATKNTEKNDFKRYCQYVGLAVVVVALIAGFHGNALELYSYLITPADKQSVIPSTTILSTLGFVTAEVFLIYTFRICLNNFYAARDELLQIQMRKALCRFAPQFKAFTGDSTITSSNDKPNDPSKNESPSTTASNNLDEFAKHIFSPLNSRMNPAPHPLDFLAQVTDAVKKVKK